MADPAREQERRELERRAFGRDGSGLSPAESARLAELRRAAASAPLGSLSEDAGGDRDETPRASGSVSSGSSSALRLASRFLSEERSDETKGAQEPDAAPACSGSLSEDAAGDRDETRRSPASPFPGSSSALRLASRFLSEERSDETKGAQEPDAAPAFSGSLSEDAGGDRDETRHSPDPASADSAGGGVSSRSAFGGTRSTSPGVAFGGARSTSPGVAFGGARSTSPVSAVRAWLATGHWKRPRYLVGGLIALLLIGIAIGAAIPRRPDTGLALRAGEDLRRENVIARTDFDPGSVILLARSDTALLWYATQSRGDLVCAIVDVKSSPPTHNCIPRRTLRGQPLDVTSQSGPGAGGVVTGDHGTVIQSDTGVPGGFLQHWTSAASPDPALGPEDTATWKRLMRENGFQYLALAGRVDGLPVWLGYRDQGDLCLIVEDEEVYKVCGPQQPPSVHHFGADQDPPTVAIDLPATGAHGTYRLEYWTGMSSYLVITANPDPRPTAPLGLKPPA